MWPKLLFLLCIIQASAVHQWSFQQRLRIPEAGDTYGTVPVGLVGRGFQTLVTGHQSGSDPGVFIHTNDDGHVNNRRVVWSQQAKLVAKDVQSGDQFGKWMVSANQTIIVSSPMAAEERGYVYIFNGTLRHWTQIQRLVVDGGAKGDRFGEYMSLHGDTVVISAKGTTVTTVENAVQTNAGAAYVYVRQSGGLHWSRQGKLVPRDAQINGGFADKIAIHDDQIVLSSKNDDLYTPAEEATYPIAKSTGAAYIFRSTSGQWSQQQKLTASDMMFSARGLREDLNLRPNYLRQLGKNVAMNKDTVAVGVNQLTPGKPNEASVYIFGGSSTTNRWSLQQRLFSSEFGANDSVPIPTTSVDVVMDHNNTLIATALGPNMSSSYIFKSFGNGWSLQQALSPCMFNSTTNSLSYTNDHDRAEQSSCVNFTSPNLIGGHLIYTGMADETKEIQIRSLYQNDSCLLLWMSDHFLDGWDTAVLTVRAPDLTNDTFHPHCDQKDPFVVRYCPYQPEDEGEYIIKVFAATKARFFWEISWMVQVEATGEWYRGDFNTKMHFNFNATTSTFNLTYSENLIDLSADASCFRCKAIAVSSWSELQITGNSAFWPLYAIGAPYYISDYSGRNVYSSGRVCDDVNSYECYQTLTDGVYILRMGGGLFGRLTEFPQNNATWYGCGVNGTHREQLIFAIASGVCKPLRIDNYTESRCFQPQAVNTAQYNPVGTKHPTNGGTMAPSQSTFGDPYKKFHMYEFDESVLSEDIEEDSAFPMFSFKTTTTATTPVTAAAAAAAANDDDYGYTTFAPTEAPFSAATGAPTSASTGDGSNGGGKGDGAIDPRESVFEQLMRKASERELERERQGTAAASTATEDKDNDDDDDGNGSGQKRRKLSTFDDMFL